MIFWVKNFALEFLGERRPEMGWKWFFFKFYEKSINGTFMIFLDEVAVS